MRAIQLKPGKEKSVKNHHPWLFSGAMQNPPSAPGVYPIHDSKNRFLAYASYNPTSSLAGRVLSWKEDFVWDAAEIERRIRIARDRRASLLSVEQTAARIVASEADHLPGLIVDLYGPAVVFQILTLGMEQVRDEIIAALLAIFEPQYLIERSDEAIRKKEGIEQRKAMIKGEWPAEGLTIIEQGMKLKVDLWEGHKTGFYLDQRANRAALRHVAKDRRVLNCFSYTGGFSVAALMGGASEVISVDESRPALNIAEANVRANGLDESRHMTVQADVFQYVRELRAKGETFDLIIMDPPKFVSDRKHLDRACRGYKDLNLLAMQLLNEGGLLATYSCSGLISRDLFQKVIFGASVDAGCDLQVIEQLSQADDHPLLLGFPESLYLKGLLARKVSIP